MVVALHLKTDGIINLDQNHQPTDQFLDQETKVESFDLKITYTHK